METRTHCGSCLITRLRAKFGLMTRSGADTLGARLEPMEERMMMSSAFASLDGSGNNVLHADWGSAGEQFLRISPAQYGDGVSAAAGQNRPSARAISNAIGDQPDDMSGNSRNLSDYLYAWGQFLDHDIDLTPTQEGADAEVLNIAVPKGDPYFDPAGTGTQVIPLVRSEPAEGTGTSKRNPRQQVNAISAFIDGSQVYGSDAATANSLRTFVGGQMKVSAGNLLPVDEASGMFMAGDIRANENPGLVSMQTLFIREHNRLASQISAQNPSLSDEEVYQRARQIVIAELQHITYTEFLPALLGSIKIPQYKGYNPRVNPGIANEFATAAYRFGHSTLNDDIGFMDNQGNEIRDDLSLAESFFNTQVVKDNGVDPILKYLASNNANELDTRIVDGLRNFLFGPPGAGGLDLAALNIQRGRDHGLADYNTTRSSYGLKKITSFNQLTSDKELQKKLKDLYGDVNKIDLWVGLLAEDHVKGSSVGQLTGKIIVEQFTRLRDGDRFWYQRTLRGDVLQKVQSTTLADVIRRNSTITNLQRNVFFFKEVAPKDPSTAAGTMETIRDSGLAGRASELAKKLSQSTLASGPAGTAVMDMLKSAQGKIKLRPVDTGAGSTSTTGASGPKFDVIRMGR